MEFAGGFALYEAAMGAVHDAFDTAKDAVFGLNSNLEENTSLFAGLMGSTDAAKKHMNDLFDFADKSPFTIPSVEAASLTLQKLGGNALDTIPNLNLLGNAAAGLNVPIEQVAQDVGVFNTLLMGGQPVQRALLPMERMGLISSDTAHKITDMVKAHADHNAILAVLMDGMHRFDGSMDRQAHTWQGAVKIFNETIEVLVSRAFQPFFKIVEDGLMALNAAMRSEAFEQFAATFSKDIAGALSTVGDIITTFGPPIIGFVKDLLTHLGPGSGAGGIAALLGGPAAAGLVQLMAPWLERFGDALGGIMRDVKAGAGVLTVVTSFFRRLGLETGQINGLLDGVGGLWNAIQRLAAVVAKDAVAAWRVWQPELEKVMVKLGPFLGAVGRLGSILLPIVIRYIEDFAKHAGPILIEFGKLAFQAIGSIISILTDLINFVSDILQGKWEAAFRDLGQAVGDLFGGIRNLLANFANDSGLHRWVDNMDQAIQDGIISAIRWFEGLPDRIVGALAGLGTDLYNAAASAMRQFVSAFSGIYIPLPHFSLTGGFNPLEWAQGQNLPGLSVNWYAQGGIFNRPSIIGVGEAGTEVAAPLSSLKALLQESASGEGWQEIADLLRKLLQVDEALLAQVSDGGDISGLEAKLLGLLDRAKRRQLKGVKLGFAPV